MKTCQAMPCCSLLAQYALNRGSRQHPRVMRGEVFRQCNLGLVGPEFDVEENGSATE
jgi:hypothetical protein